MDEYINQLKVMLKVRKEQKEIIECSGGSCCNCNPDIQALEQAIEIMGKYLQLKKENKELKRKYNAQPVLLNNSMYFIDSEVYENLLVDIRKNYIPKSVIREKIEELEKYEKIAKEQIENTIVIADSDSLNYGRAEAHCKDIQILKELCWEE